MREFQWEGLTANGMLVVQTGANGQSVARAMGVRRIAVMGPGIDSQFFIDIPSGAEPVIFRTEVVGSDGSRKTTYSYGWEKEGRRKVWEFGNGFPELHTSP